jgi:FAD/FMN-containing dehydrogenase
MNDDVAPIRLPAPPQLRGTFATDDAARDAHAGASGVLRRRPAAVAAPHDADDLARLVGWAATHGIALVPRGAATGMPGGNVGPGVAVDLMTGFGAILEIDPPLARVEPGVTRGALNAACLPLGQEFPVDPSSGERCSFGGMIANNSSGARSVRYGAVRRWVESLDLVLADGSRCTTRRGESSRDPALAAVLAGLDAYLAPRRGAIEQGWPRVRKNSSGYALREYLRSGDAIDLIVGSEGTLALVAAAEVRLSAIPAARGLALIELTSLEAAAEAVITLLRLEPATCEMMDRTLIELIREAGADSAYPLSPGLEAILLVEVEAESAEAVQERLALVDGAVRGLARRVVRASAPDDQRRIWRVRHAASPLIAQRSDGRVSMQFIEDGVVPVERLPDYVRLLRAVLARHRVPAVIFGHAGEGNLHVNPLVDVRAPDWRGTIEAILYEVAEGVAAMGGTMAGEHGDGRLRAPLLERVWGAEMVGIFREVKQAFDPAGILNPGVILPLPGQRPLDALRDYPA